MLVNLYPFVAFDFFLLLLHFYSSNDIFTTMAPSSLPHFQKISPVSIACIRRRVLSWTTFFAQDGSRITSSLTLSSVSFSKALMLSATCINYHEEILRLLQSPSFISKARLFFRFFSIFVLSTKDQNHSSAFLKSQCMLSEHLLYVSVRREADCLNTSYRDFAFFVLSAYFIFPKQPTAFYIMYNRFLFIDWLFELSRSSRGAE